MFQQNNTACEDDDWENSPNLTVVTTQNENDEEIELTKCRELHQAIQLDQQRQQLERLEKLEKERLKKVTISKPTQSTFVRPTPPTKLGKAEKRHISEEKWEISACCRGMANNAYTPQVFKTTEEKRKTALDKDLAKQLVTALLNRSKTGKTEAIIREEFRQIQLSRQPKVLTQQEKEDKLADLQARIYDLKIQLDQTSDKAMRMQLTRQLFELED